ncbi:MAG: MFS transporter [Bifidobacteriaceae bacterium]|jgi:DHA3 family macrolide efflux protein-like MFS transporter|nr:MFS transporter [Bifidobacteriaceae bacterium]
MTSAHSPQTSATGRELPSNWASPVVFIWTGQAFSIVTSYAAMFAAIWYITETTNSAKWLSLAALVSLLPTGLLSPFGGVLADRFNRRSMMLLADGTVGLASAVLGLSIWLGQAGLGMMLLILAVRGAAQAFHTPALMAAMPSLVPERHLLRVNSVSQLLWSAAGIGAPALGILFYEAIGLHWVMFLDAAGAAVACLGLAFASIPTVRDPSMRGQRVLTNLADGLRAIRASRGLFALMVLCVGAMVVFMPIGSLFPLMTYQHFAGSGYMGALIEAVWGVSMLVGSLVLLAWGGGKRHVLLVIGSGLGVGLLIAACGALPATAFWAFAVLTGLMGFVCSFYNGPLFTIIQRRIPEQKQGRAMGLFSSAMSLASPIGLAISGFAAERTGIAGWFLICGFVMAAISALPLALPSIRALDRPAAPPPAA